MKLVSVIESTVIRFEHPAADTNAFLPSLINAVREEFRFVEYPQRAADFNLEAGVTLLLGWFNGTQIQKAQFYRNGLLLEGSADTAALDRCADEIERIFLERFQVNLRPSAPIAKRYTSRIEVRAASVDQARLSQFQAAQSRLSEFIAGYGIEASVVEVTGLVMNADATKTLGDLKPGRFLLERRTGRPFEENLFYSEAPLTTDQHLEILNMLEGLI